MAHKLREARSGPGVRPSSSPARSSATAGYSGGTPKVKNVEAERADRRLAEEQIGKHQSVVVARGLLAAA
jgi:hypothetical protein